MSTPSAELNPYVGPHPFRTEQGHLFFGREREANELLSLVIANRVVLFFAQSGAGKTSLLNTRLIPGLEEKKFEVLPVGRVSGDRPGALPVANIFVFNLMAFLHEADFDVAAFAQLPLSDFLVHLTHTGGKWVYEKAGTPAAAGAAPAGTGQAGDALPAIGDELEIRPRLLIVDQFEEILTAHPEAWEQRAEFFRQVRQSLDEDPFLWVLFAMREDFVAALSPYAHLLPDGLRTRYHMLPMDAEAALDAIKLPAALGKHEFAPGVAEVLVKNLRQVEDQQPQSGLAEVDTGSSPSAAMWEWWTRSQIGLAEVGTGIPPGTDAAELQFVEPVQLQVVCRQLWDSLATPPGTPITMADLEKLAGGAGPGEFVSDALRVYYEQSLASALRQAPEGISQRVLRNWFDQVVITKEGKRNLIHQAENESGGMPNQVVTPLVDRFILRRETQGGRRWIELAHDRFVEPIRRSNRQWFAQEPSPTRVWTELWLNAGKNPAFLLTGDDLKQTVARFRAHPSEFQPLEQEFIQTSQEVANKTTDKLKKLALGLLSVALVLLFWGMAYTYSMYERYVALEGAARADGLALTAVSLLDQPRLALLLAAHSSQIEREARTPLAPVVEQARQNIAAAAGGAGTVIAPVAPAVEQALQRVLGATGGTVIPLDEGMDPYAVALSAGDKIAVGDTSGAVRVRDLAAENSAWQPLPGQGGAVQSLHFTPDGNSLVSLDDSGAVRLWNLADPAPEPAVLNIGGEQIWAVALLSDTLATANIDGQLRLWDFTQPGEPVLEWGYPGGLPTHAVFSRDGRYLVTAGNDGDDGSVRSWDLAATPPISETVRTGGVRVGGLAASPTTDQIAVSREDGTITLYDLPGLEEATVLRGPRPVVTGGALWSSIAFLPGAGGLRLAGTYAGDNKIRVWDLDNPQDEPAEVRGHEGEIRQLAVGPDSKMATVGAGGEVRVWDTHNLTYQPENLVEVQSPVVNMTLSPGGDYLAAAYMRDGRAHLAQMNDLATTRAVGDGTAGDVTAVAFGASDDVLLIGTVEGTLSAWDLGAAATAAPLWTRSAHSERINEIAVKRQRGWAATASDDGTVRTWDLSDGSELDVLKPINPSQILDVAFSPDGSILAAGDQDGRVHRWDMTAETKKEVQMLGAAGSGFTSLAFNADGSELAAAQEDGSIWRWKSDTGEALPAPPPGKPVSAIAFDCRPFRSHLLQTKKHDCRHLITGHDNGEINLWYLEAMDTLPTSLAGHSERVNDLIVEPEDKKPVIVEPEDKHPLSVEPEAKDLLSAGDDGFVRRWELDVDSLVEKACRGAEGRMISPDEKKAYLSRQMSGRAADDICDEAPTRPQ